jgi:CRP-like cAMP-binding protein
MGISMTIDNIIYAYIVKEEVVQPNSTIIEEGAQGDWLFVLLEGKVKVKKHTQKGVITLYTLGEGAIVGETGLVMKKKHVRAVSIVSEGVVKLGILDKERLEKEYELLSPQLQSLIKTMVLRLKETTDKVSLLAAEMH